MFNQRPIQPRKELDGCEIEIRKTKTGKRIKFKGNCRKDQIEAFAKDNGIDLDD